MADESDNLVLRHLREFRTEMGEFRASVNARFDAVDKRFDAVDKRLGKVEYNISLLADGLIYMRRDIECLDHIEHHFGPPASE